MTRRLRLALPLVALFAACASPTEGVNRVADACTTIDDDAKRLRYAEQAADADDRWKRFAEIVRDLPEARRAIDSDDQDDEAARELEAEYGAVCDSDEIQEESEDAFRRVYPNGL